MNKGLSLAAYILSSPSRTAAFLFSEIPLWAVFLLLFSETFSSVQAVILVLLIFMSRALVKSFMDTNVYSSFFKEITQFVFIFFSLIIFAVLIISSAVAIALSGSSVFTLMLLIFIIIFSVFHAFFLKPDITRKLWGKNIKTPSTFFYDLLISLGWITVFLLWGKTGDIIFMLIIIILLQYKKMMKMYESVL
ncbi:MAG: hypothetical protein FXF49_01160 [Flexistipes sinusarabici]|uniref:Uncharacterized protein n=1 Tax=Flexistipes sinusarabici TaxID=2352 RepID=A0A5D0MUK6_FLESI|nr:hypothetical protein [Flexistipes sinusarabici]TYB35820.1 MAG: hypothetical protein FXF49_01160 [Flexistipes sinusarabici]